MVTPIGLIGLGLMGSALAERLLGAGHRVIGWDIDPGRIAALRERGGEVAKDAQQVFSGCRRVLLSLPSHREVSDVVQAAGALLTRGLTIIDTTTGDPASTESWRESRRSRDHLSGCDHFRQQRAGSSRLGDADGRRRRGVVRQRVRTFSRPSGGRPFTPDLPARARR